MSALRAVASVALAFGLAAGTAVAQTNPQNPHDVKSPDRAAPPPASASQVDAAEKGDPNSVQNKDKTSMAGKPDLDKAEAESPHAVKNNDHATASTMLDKLHAANLEEIDAGKLAAKQGGPRAAEFGKMLAADHQKADDKVQMLANKRGMTLQADPMMSTKSHELHEKLAGLNGAAFDKEFANAMVEGHKKVISMVESWRAGCTDGDICSMLDDTLPVLRHHQKAAEELKMPAAQGRSPR